MAEFHKTDLEVTSTSPPPDVVLMLANILRNSKRKPKMFPSDPIAGAHYWINHQEPANEEREKIEKRLENGKHFWVTPYHDRVCSTLKTFLWLKNIHQSFVIEAIERGVPWRGDKIEFYQKVIDETEKMQRNIPEYIEGALVAMKNFKIKGAA